METFEDVRPAPRALFGANAVRSGDGCTIGGAKGWTSPARHIVLMLLPARTTPGERGVRPHDGTSGLPLSY
ncbi:MAG: hypothetical protein U1E35_06040 [Rhodospirillales bacterium]